jgi:hypothetical protein
MAPGKIVFKEIKVETMERNAGIFIGINIAPGWTVYSKNQTALSVSGKNNKVFKNVSILYDNDVFDTTYKEPLNTVKSEGVMGELFTTASVSAKKKLRVRQTPASGEYFHNRRRKIKRREDTAANKTTRSAVYDRAKQDQRGSKGIGHTSSRGHRPA